MNYRYRHIILAAISVVLSTMGAATAIVVVETTTVGGSTSTTTYADNQDFFLPASSTIRRHRIWANMADPLAPKPYVIKRRNAETYSDETDESGCFEQTRDATNPTIVRIAPLADNLIVRGFEYVFERRRFMNGSVEENVLRSALPNGSAPPVIDYDPLIFTVCEKGNAAYGDAINDGCVDFADVTNVLANFGLGLNDCGKLGDANRDGVVTFADVTTVLTFFDEFEYFPLCMSGMAVGGSGEAGNGLAEMAVDPGVSAAEASGLCLTRCV